MDLENYHDVLTLCLPNHIFSPCPLCHYPPDVFGSLLCYSPRCLSFHTPVQDAVAVTVIFLGNKSDIVSWSYVFSIRLVKTESLPHLDTLDIIYLSYLPFLFSLKRLSPNLLYGLLTLTVCCLLSTLPPSGSSVSWYF